jgi:hypothetical protein
LSVDLALLASPVVALDDLDPKIAEQGSDLGGSCDDASRSLDSERIRGEDRPHELDSAGRGKLRRRLRIWIPVGVLVLAAALVTPIRDWYRNHPHGTPDPGGRRLSALIDAATNAVRLLLSR